MKKIGLGFLSCVVAGLVMGAGQMLSWFLSTQEDCFEWYGVFVGYYSMCRLVSTVLLIVALVKLAYTNIGLHKSVWWGFFVLQFLCGGVFASMFALNVVLVSPLTPCLMVSGMMLGTTLLSYVLGTLCLPAEYRKANPLHDK